METSLPGLELEFRGGFASKMFETYSDVVHIYQGPTTEMLLPLIVPASEEKKTTMRPQLSSKEHGGKNETVLVFSLVNRHYFILYGRTKAEICILLNEMAEHRF